MVCACGPTLRTFIDRQIKTLKSVTSNKSWSRSWSRTWSRSWSLSNKSSAHSNSHGTATTTYGKSSRLDSEASSNLPHFIEMLQGRQTKNKTLVSSNAVGDADSASLEHIVDDEVELQQQRRVQEGIMVHTSYQVRTVKETV